MCFRTSKKASGVEGHHAERLSGGKWGSRGSGGGSGWGAGGSLCTSGKILDFRGIWLLTPLCPACPIKASSLAFPTQEVIYLLGGLPSPPNHDPQAAGPFNSVSLAPTGHLEWISHAFVVKQWVLSFDRGYQIWMKKKKNNNCGFPIFQEFLQFSPISSQLNSTNICCLPSLCKALCWVWGIQEWKVKK